MLQAGGVQEAMTVAFPGRTDVTVPADAVKAEASEVLQVRGTPVISVFDESVTVAVMTFDPLCSVNEVWVVFSIASEMDWTAQVVNCTGGLFTPAEIATIPVIPGLTAVTRACPGSSPLAVVVRVATAVLRVPQLNGPTLDVM